jgi:hypothetical protein
MDRQTPETTIGELIMTHLWDDIIALSIYPTAVYIALRIATRTPKMNLKGLHTITWYTGSNTQQTKTCYITTDRHRIYHRMNPNQRWRLLCYTDQVITTHQHGKG